MLNSKYAPTSTNDYGSKDLSSDLQGIKFTAPLGVVTTNDLLISEDHLIDGVELTAINAALGDFLTCQIIDINNVMGLGSNTVLSQYITNWYMNPSLTTQLDFKINYPARISGGVYLRLKYTSVGTTAVQVICNYILHKVLW